MKKHPATIGARDLSAFIARSSFNVERMAAGIGVPERTLYRWLQGDSRISLYGAHAIEAWTGGIVRAVSWLNAKEYDDLKAIR